MKPAEAIAIARQFTTGHGNRREDPSSIATAKTLGAAAGALLSTGILAWIGVPSDPAVFIWAFATLTGRSIGGATAGWAAERRLKSGREPTWEHTQLLQNALRQLGVDEEWIGPVVQEIMSTGPSVELLNDPAHILRLVPKEAFKTSVAIASGSTSAKAMLGPTPSNQKGDPA